MASRKKERRNGRKVNLWRRQVRARIQEKTGVWVPSGLPNSELAQRATDAFDLSQPVSWSKTECHRIFQEIIELSPLNGPAKPPKIEARSAKYDPDWVNSSAFLASFEWRRVRMIALKANDGRCECCGHGKADGVKLHVDHIKSRRKHPALALHPNNLQVLCEVCNHGKGNWDETDWRGPGEAAP